MGIFSSAKEAEEKYTALENELSEYKLRVEKLNEEIGALNDEIAQLKAEDLKATIENRLAIAVEAGIATKEVAEVLFAEDDLSAAKATLKAVRSEGSVVSATSDIDDGEIDDKANSERLAEIEARVKKSLGKV